MEAKFERTTLLPSIVCKNMDEIKENVNEVLDAFEDLGEDTMICVVVSNKNADSTRTTSIGAASLKELEKIRFHNACIGELLIRRTGGVTVLETIVEEKKPKEDNSDLDSGAVPIYAETSDD
jgi:hypothetical protein